MNRLGMDPTDAPEIIRTLRANPAAAPPQSVLTHLAEAENPHSALSQMQAQKFAALIDLWKSIFPKIRFHMGNSAALWNARAWKLGGLTHLVRPGISLYGIPPWAQAKSFGLKPVLTLKAPVMDVRAIRRSESVGYNGTFIASRKLNVAVLAGGYGDGIHRSLGNRGHVWLEGKRCAVIGNVSMDLTTVKCPASTQIGNWAELWGPHINPWRQAQSAGTIPYEMLTSISDRVLRTYE